MEQFREKMAPTILLILGLACSSLDQLDSAEQFLTAFKAHVKNSHVLRRWELRMASSKCDDTLVSVYQKKIDALGFDIDEHMDKAEELANKITTIDPRNYAAQITLAYICEARGNTSRALTHYQTAAQNARRDVHHHLFDAAYFALKNSNFNKALAIYEDMMKEY